MTVRELLEREGVMGLGETPWDYKVLGPEGVEDELTVRVSIKRTLRAPWERYRVSVREPVLVRESSASCT